MINHNIIGINMCKYNELKPIEGEEKDVEFDDEFQQFGIFGLESGFCYESYCDESEAYDRLSEILSKKT